MTVYLIHFQTPIGNTDNPRAQAQHYLGSCETGRLQQRLLEHRQGNGAAIMRAVHDAGIPWTVTRTWHGTRELERTLKAEHNNRMLCPLCNPNAYNRRKEP